ncbi:MAG: orotidine-5'-phosphate decarboxylase [Spirochaetales bacterium]|nr:orotidine-5'-phosphate decarboxylase [Spirochaetales bacterium]
MLSIDKLIYEMKKRKSAICLGLDPFIEKIPSKFIEEGEFYFGKTQSAYSYAILQFNKKVLELCKDKIAVVKPQFSLYLRFGVEGVLTFKNTVSYAKELGFLVIIDAKSNDIDSSMEGYIDGFLGKTKIFENEFTSFDADFLTINPYLGVDSFKSLKKSIDTCEKGAFILAKTSNPSSNDFQDKLIEGKPLYWHVAKRITEYFSDYNKENGFLPVGIVVGATMQDELKLLREEFPDLFFLIPGYGTQGGTIESLSNIVKENFGFVVNASRSILYSYLDRYKDYDFESAILKSIDEMNDELNKVVKY